MNDKNGYRHTLNRKLREFDSLKRLVGCKEKAAQAAFSIRYM